MSTLPIKHFLKFDDFSREEIEYLLKRADFIKKRFKNYETWHPLQDRSLVMIFEKASTRTRLSFEAGMLQLGDIIMMRTFEQDIIERFAAASRVPVINGLTNEYHPCQILADIFTYMEHRGSIQGKTVAWVGDANNMSYTWVQAARLLDFQVHISTPPGYALDDARISDAERKHLRYFEDPREACAGADLVTTDVWTSMGYEAENEARRAAFANFCVDAPMMASAHPDALFMHCLPAHRGEEVTAEVIDGPQSVVWDEAENRLHVQKALLEYLVIGRVPT